MEISKLALELTTLHGRLQRAQEKDRLVALRQKLPEKDQTLLILRIDREMEWNEIAEVFEPEAEPLTPEALKKKSNRLRQQMVEITKTLKKLEEAEGKS